jgi:hypothetical protein
VSSAEDIDKLIQALFGGRPLPADLLSQMITRHASQVLQGLDYGLWLMLKDSECGPAVGHVGDSWAMPPTHTLCFGETEKSSSWSIGSTRKCQQKRWLPL